MAIPPKEVREKRGLIETRQKLVGRRVALQNRIRAILVAQGLPAPCGHKAWTQIGLAGIAAHDLYHTGQVQLIKKLMP